MQLPEIFYLVDPTNNRFSAHRVSISAEPVHGFVESIRSQLIDSPVRLPTIAGTHFVYTPEKMLLAVRKVDEIVLNTTYWPASEKSLSPVFGTMGVRAEFKYVPPAAHYFMMSLSEEMFPEIFYLFVKHDGGTYTPNLPNCYSDGRLCMGDFTHNVTTLRERGVTDPALLMDAAFADFQSNSWNSDLRPPASMGRIIRFDTEGKQEPLSDDDEDYYFNSLRRCSSDHINTVVELLDDDLVEES